jgi:hypothetical protein
MKTSKPNDFYKTTNSYNITKKEPSKKPVARLVRSPSYENNLISRAIYQPDISGHYSPPFVDED